MILEIRSVLHDEMGEGERKVKTKWRFAAWNKAETGLLKCCQQSCKVIGNRKIGAELVQIFIASGRKMRLDGSKRHTAMFVFFVALRSKFTGSL